jgi:hypothetical protein
MDYGIAMSFITWMIITLMTTGILLIQLSKYTVKANDDKVSDFDKKNAEMLLEMFYNHDFTGKLMMVLHIGASFWAFLFFGLKDTMKGDK